MCLRLISFAVVIYVFKIFSYFNGNKYRFKDIFYHAFLQLFLVHLKIISCEYKFSKSKYFFKTKFENILMVISLGF